MSVEIAPLHIRIAGGIWKAFAGCLYSFLLLLLNLDGQPLPVTVHRCDSCCFQLRALGLIRHKSRSLSPRREKRRPSRSRSRSPIVHGSRSPSLVSLDRRRAHGRVREDEESERRRRQQEAELKLIEEETAKRVEEAIRKKVSEALNSEEVKLEIARKIQEGRKKIFDDISIQLLQEKEEALSEARRKEEQERREKEELERMLEENRKKIEEAQRRAAEEQARKEEERYRELEALQLQKEEALRRKKLEEEQERAEQTKILGKKNARPKLSFAFGSK
ncbi:hypothetical protein O6H91_09G121400 [Diphasiastrum complanatum]|uniref:Uncharacterized protein n=2 Tax=Diphasiastrum complanatum TaxID=34168 RepID=A0ACC2CU36_DIPCM|nr:hypothetical protein O6H91_09G121400 [Diphasiastrum complanatum]KAJ7545468.1 hypothetical protein O6H91_09G121400 [Diphasiastrum complanatum]